MYVQIVELFRSVRLDRCMLSLLNRFLLCATGKYYNQSKWLELENSTHILFNHFNSNKCHVETFIWLYCLPACLSGYFKPKYTLRILCTQFLYGFFLFLFKLFNVLFFASFQGWLNFRVIKRVQFGCRPYFLLGPKKIKNIMLYGTNNEPLWAHHFDLSVYFFFHVYRASKFSLPLCTRFVATQYSVLYGSFL